LDFFEKKKVEEGRWSWPFSSWLDFFVFDLRACVGEKKSRAAVCVLICELRRSNSGERERGERASERASDLGRKSRMRSAPTLDFFFEMSACVRKECEFGLTVETRSERLRLGQAARSRSTDRPPWTFWRKGRLFELRGGRGRRPLGLFEEKSRVS